MAMAASFPPKISPMLMTSEPHYVPGYAGYCPQYKFRGGKTYGKLTSELLTNPDMALSGHLLLQSSLVKPGAGEGGAETRDVPLTSRRISWRDQRLSPSLIPGYTGFVPKSQNYFAKTYTESSRAALMDFEREQLQLASKKEQMDFVEAMRSEKATPQTREEKEVRGLGLLFLSIATVCLGVCLSRAGSGYLVRRHVTLLAVKYVTPLTPITRDVPPYHSPHSPKPSRSPYFAEKRDPNKYFISGFSGHVPRARFLFGSSYPVTTNRALVQFGEMLSQAQSVAEANAGSAVPSHKEESVKLLPQRNVIYPATLGLLPRYTGYIPGYKFQFGHTYGHLTHDALGTSTFQKQAAA
ncbi:ciliary microtubule inner protein 2B [Latimeria chalumnae]|uniref:ciliary microtubule inner protein 2B n=1 Tax=Latimeria chalumnae TaxID=7897 RepID=UPI00313EA3B8